MLLTLRRDMVIPVCVRFMPGAGRMVQIGRTLNRFVTLGNSRSAGVFTAAGQASDVATDNRGQM